MGDHGPWTRARRRHRAAGGGDGESRGRRPRCGSGRPHGPFQGLRDDGRRPRSAQPAASGLLLRRALGHGRSVQRPSRPSRAAREQRRPSSSRPQCSHPALHTPSRTSTPAAPSANALDPAQATAALPLQALLVRLAATSTRRPAPASLCSFAAGKARRARRHRRQRLP